MDQKLTAARERMKHSLMDYRIALVDELRAVDLLLGVPTKSDVMSGDFRVEDRPPSSRSSEKLYTRDDYYLRVVNFLRLQGSANRRQISDHLNTTQHMETTPDSVWGFLRREFDRGDSMIEKDHDKPGYFKLKHR